MKNKSVFSQIMLLVILFVVCVVLTIVVAFFAGSFKTDFFDFSNLNFSNMIPFLIIGGFISCVVVGVTIIFVSRSIFFKIKDYLSDNNGGDKK